MWPVKTPISYHGVTQEVWLMLVLSRRQHQEVVFPNLGITVQILKVRGHIVKIGIDAPKHVSVIRREVYEADCPEPDPRDQLSHQLRNELNLLQLRVTALQRRLGQGETIDAEATLQSLFQGVDVVDRQMAHFQHPRDSVSNQRLLVVEDCDNERKLMAYVLASHGFEVHVARDGAEALQWLNAATTLPAVVLMDMQMPLSNGLEALERIRHDQRLQDLLVFAVTGAKRSPEMELVGHGWDAWFSKPLDVQRLVETIAAQTRQSTIASEESVI
ncbi:MAG: response regulator [Planctomycetaceae bacterium]|nr:response regulator [Planctomycetaceae bacterium]